MDDKLTAMMEMLKKSIPHGAKEPADIQPEVLANIAKQSGCKSTNEMKTELAGMSQKMMGKKPNLLCILH